MQAVAALDFRRGPYTQLLAKQGDVEDTCAVRQPWSEWHQFIAMIGLTVLLIPIMSTGNFNSIPAAKTGDLIDAATFLFPHISNTTSRDLSSLHTVEGRPDIKSFGYDLGGSTCACTLQWDRSQYWQRVWYGMKYVYAHVFTVFFGVILFQRWKWVLIYKVANECLEELAMPVLGKWAATVAIQDVEPRYDSFVNDLVLAAIPFMGLGCHLLYVVDMPDPFPDGLEYNVKNYKSVSILLFEFWVLITYAVVGGKFGGNTIRVSDIHIDVGKCVVSFLQMMILYFVWFMRALPIKLYYEVLAVALIILCPFVFYSDRVSPNEQIAAVLSFALAGIVTSVYHKCYTNKSRYVLAFALPLYLSAFVLYVSFSSVVSAPQNQFYYKRMWCGIGFGGKQESCSRIRY